ncbi:hypothetical protein Syun_023935 [Stephania yunnanensis]|uniref:ABC transmembrane type-1 domain-containing protein n=1 Tax=Stephania yunnanensis TaxID=152371 RepID=A0AAP0I3X2_9MAGN
MGLARKVRKEYIKAGAIAEQAISSIRTVYSFVGEKKTINEYTAALNGSMKLAEARSSQRRGNSESMGGETLQNVSGEVEFKNVKFAYPSRPTNVIFHNLNLKISAGKKLALVGVSGSGKSTVIALLERFYDPLDGQILLDGICHGAIK